MAGEQRRLAAIIAADVVGYSRLMGRDESGTLARLREHRKQRFEPIVDRFGGRIVKLTGDGALAEFPSAVGALSAAIAFQQAMSETNQTESADTPIVFRIGLHLGDLIVDGDDLYGDGVNIAARLEREAPPGGIVVSGTVHGLVEGRLKATFSDLGDLALKNIERPVRAMRVSWQAADWPTAADTPTPSPVPTSAAPSESSLAPPDRPSIAVLPFDNMSGDPDQEYFVDGLVEDIITALSRFKSLFVIARNSSFTYKGKAVDIKQVGRELGVRYVLEGSVRKTGNRLRITGQLIEAQSGAHLWADRFDGALQDVFDLQDKVTESVASKVIPHVRRAEIERARRKPTANVDAYDCYLRGLSFLYDPTSEHRCEEALVQFQRAIELDPDFAVPYGGVAQCHVWRMNAGGSRDGQEAEVRHLAARVSAMGTDDPDALSWIGGALLYVCREYETGLVMIDQAIEMNPNSARAWMTRGFACLFIGHHEEACLAVDQAMRLSPYSVADAQRCKVAALTFLGHHAEAVALAEQVLARQPRLTATLRVVAMAHAIAGNNERAAEIGARLLEINPTLRASALRDYVPYRRAEDVALYVDGLRRSGIPE